MAAALLSTLGIILTSIQIESLIMTQEIPQPPVAKKVPKETRIHGYTILDNYAWLRDDKRQDPEVINYLKAEDEYADIMVKHTEVFREGLYKEMLARIKETDEQVPYQQGDYFYYSRTEQGKQYSIFCRKKGKLQAVEEITIDQNKMAE